MTIRESMEERIRKGEWDAAKFFAQIYSGIPPWDIGRPQPAFVHLEEAGEIAGSVLDAGCGTGENALYLAARGHEVCGIDLVPEAISRAQEKAKTRKIPARFFVRDVLRMEGATKPFDSIIDSGLFHAFMDDERPRYAESLVRLARPGGRYFMLCFSEHEPGSWGPRRVTREEIRDVFSGKWKIDSIRETRFVHNIDLSGARAYLASMTRLQGRRGERNAKAGKISCSGEILEGKITALGGSGSWCLRPRRSGIPCLRYPFRRLKKISLREKMGVKGCSPHAASPFEERGGHLRNCHRGSTGSH